MDNQTYYSKNPFLPKEIKIRTNKGGNAVEDDYDEYRDHDNEWFDTDGEPGTRM